MDMELTQNFLRGKNPCAMGYRWFVRNNLSGGDYQAAMDTQVAAGRVDDARWLLENFGATHSVLEVDHLEADNFVYAGTLIVRGDVRVPGQLLVGRGLQVGGGIRAGKLEVGEDIKAVVPSSAMSCCRQAAASRPRGAWKCKAMCKAMRPPISAPQNCVRDGSWCAAAM